MGSMALFPDRKYVISLLSKFIKFLSISGIGWLMDFTIYCIFVYIFFVPVFWANISGAAPAVTFVFFVAIRKVFKKKSSYLPL